MKITIREGMVPGDDLPSRLRWLGDMGIDGLELHTDSLLMQPDELESHLRDAGIEASAVEGIPHLLSPDATARTAAIRGIQDRLHLAARLGAVGVLIVPQFGRTPTLPDYAPLLGAAELERQLLIAQMKPLTQLAMELGVSLFYEPLNRYEAYIVNRVEQGAALATETGPGTATMADFFHMNIEEADIAAAIRNNAESIVYVHVADSNRIQPGRGHIDFAAGFAALKAIGYDGWLGIECRIDGDMDTEVRKTVAHIRDVWASA